MKHPIYLSMLLIAVVLTGTFSARSSDERWLTVYYLADSNPAKTNLVPVRILVNPTLPGEKAIRLAFEMMKHPPCNNLRTAIAENLTLLSVNINQSVVTINLSSQVDDIAGTTGAGEFLDQLTWTLLGIKDLEKITFEIEGVPQESITAEGFYVKDGVKKNLRSAVVVPLVD